MLITILLIAVFWNGLPSMKSNGNLLPISWKQFFQQDEEESDREARQTESIPIAPTVPYDIPDEKEQTIELTEVPTNQEEFQDQFDVTPLASPAAVEAELSKDFVTIKRTLEQKYGATEVLLEPWGSEEKMYRFSCYISEPKGSSVKKLHQSIQATPALAIQKVMETVKE
jgi:hypothetical protein